MFTFLATFGLFLAAVAAMAIGVLLAGKRLSGSCGGRGPDGEMLADCLCEIVREKARARGEDAPELPACAPSRLRELSQSH